MIHCLFGLTLAEWIFKCYVCILAIISSWKRAQLTTIRKKEIERKKTQNGVPDICAKYCCFGLRVCWFFSLIWLERLTRMQKVCVRIPVTTAKVV